MLTPLLWNLLEGRFGCPMTLMNSLDNQTTMASLAVLLPYQYDCMFIISPFKPDTPNPVSELKNAFG